DLARLLLERQQLDLALAEGLRAEQGGEKDPQLGVMLATLENTAGAYDDALHHALAVVKASDLPNAVRAAAAAVAGLSSAGLEQRQEAVKHLELAIQLAPDQENSYLALADLYAKAQEHRRAAEVLEQGRRRQPDSSALLVALGSNLLSAGDATAAVRVLAEVTERFPDRVDSYPQL